MSALNGKPEMLDRATALWARFKKAVFCMVGIFAFVVQMLIPTGSMAQNGDWIEICSELGAVFIQVDMTDEDTPQKTECPDCADCLLCAAVGFDVVRLSHPHLASLQTEISTWQPDPASAIEGTYRAWPYTRGPPLGRPEISNRVFSAFSASIQVNGGAL